MAEFRVTVKGGRNEVEYPVYENAHNDTAVEAAREALATYARHGHSSFPYNDGPLSVEVVPVSPTEDNAAHDCTERGE